MAEALSASKILDAFGGGAPNEATALRQGTVGEVSAARRMWTMSGAPAVATLVPPSSPPPSERWWQRRSELAAEVAARSKVARGVVMKSRIAGKLAYFKMRPFAVGGDPS